MNFARGDCSLSLGHSGEGEMLQAGQGKPATCTQRPVSPTAPNNTKFYFPVTLGTLREVAVSTEIRISAAEQDLLAWGGGVDGTKSCVVQED